MQTRKDLKLIRIPGADMTNAKSDYVSWNNANLSGVWFRRAELSLCEFDGTNLDGCLLNQATVMCSSFTNASRLAGADVSGCLLLLSTFDGNELTREWLGSKGANNSNLAITDLESLNQMLESSEIKPEAAAHYIEKINSIYGLLNSMKIRKERSLFVDPSWLPLLEYSTPENLEVLKHAYIMLNNCTLEKDCDLSIPSFS